MVNPNRELDGFGKQRAASGIPASARFGMPCIRGGAGASSSRFAATVLANWRRGQDVPSPPQVARTKQRSKRQILNDGIIPDDIFEEPADDADNDSNPDT
ncbi:MAG: hypothetical protein SF182_17070 [Deltaproteobacteria bacterium]|nr:hypothetical protein [Deltaproteobacteria bacterium]